MPTSGAMATMPMAMVDETLDNITEHSESDRGYIFAQAYPRKGYLDKCIVDRGVTLLGSRLYQMKGYFTPEEKTSACHILEMMDAVRSEGQRLRSEFTNEWWNE